MPGVLVEDLSRVHRARDLVSASVCARQCVLRDVAPMRAAMDAALHYVDSFTT